MFVLLVRLVSETATGIKFVLHFFLVEEVWNSGNDLAREGHFVWRSTGQPFSYSHWTSAREYRTISQTVFMLLIAIK